MKIRYYLQESFAIIISLLMFSAASICNAEEITLTTYYPSPYGVYSEMRLYPKNSPSMTCDSEREGLMFYSEGSNALYPRGLYVCGQAPLGGYSWNPISGLWSRDGTDLYPTDLSWNVGIGKTNPGTKLDVAGTARAIDFTCIDCLGPGDIGDGLGVSEIDETVIQRRVFDACGLGSSIRVINQDGSVECEPDDGGGVGGNITIAAPGGSSTGSSFNFVGNVTYSGGDTFTFGGGGGGVGSVYSLTGGLGITLSGAGVVGNTWDPNAGTATISSTGGVGIVTPWFSPVYKEKNGADGTFNLGLPGQFSFCALAYHWENTGGGGDDASCGVALSGTQWTLTAQTGTDADVKCQAICF